MGKIRSEFSRGSDRVPIAVRSYLRAGHWADRLCKLAFTQGWRLLEEYEEGPAQVSVISSEDPRLAESATPPGSPTGATGAWVELIESSAADPTVSRPGLVSILPADADDRIWVTVVENAARAGVVVQQHCQRIEHLLEVSATDAMTGLFNRSHMLSSLEREFKRFERSGEPLSCIMIDIDHFKNINDTYGHSFGDKILVTFAELLGASIRDSDILGRYGGEEFLCLVPSTDLEGACALAEKLRLAIESKVFAVSFFNLELTASFGVSSSSLAEVTGPDQLLQWSDRALYRAKQSGRNRVCVADGAHPSSADPSSSRSASPAATDKPVVLLAHSRIEELVFYHALKAGGVFEVVEMSTAEEALDYLTRHTPSAALIESELPPKSGWDLLRRIRSRTGDDYFPVAIIQPPGVTAIEDMAYRAGADDVLSDRIGYSELSRRLQVFLRLRLLHQRFQETYDRLTAARARLVKAERLSALGQMASGVAHDFNNVLSAILGRTQMLMRDFKDERLHSALEVIQSAASDGAQTIKRIQDFSRSISSLDSSPLVVADVVRDCVQLTRVRWKDEAEHRGVKYRVHTDVDSCLTTLGNPTELREVFTNLIINALDAMPDGGVVEIHSRAPEGSERFFVEVRDDGAGMEPEVVQRVFEPFFTTKSERGTGLGLSIIYGIITRMGGQIEVRSRPGQGTTFRLWFLPPKPSEATEDYSRVSVPVEVSLQSAPCKLSVLVVEDEPSVRDLFVDVLREEGHSVQAASCAREAMSICADHVFDAVLTDLGMPDLPGWDVARYVKERSSRTCVILTSGWGDEFSPEYLDRRGVDHWLPKPVSLDELFALLRSVEPLEANQDRGTA